MLADFGIAVDVSYKRAKSTTLLRGTRGYRAPEVLVEYRYSVKVDIWALGCIIHELATGLPAFGSDMKVEEYYRRNGTWKPDVGGLRGFLEHQYVEIIYDLLNRDWTARPDAEEVDSMFSSYNQLLAYEFTDEIEDLPVFPSYSCWKECIRTRPHRWELLYLLVDVSRRHSEPLDFTTMKAVANALRLEYERGFENYRDSRYFEKPLEECLQQVESAIDGYMDVS